MLGVASPQNQFANRAIEDSEQELLDFMSRHVLLVFAFLIAGALQLASAQTVACQPRPESQANYMCAMWQSTDPESWIRGSASLDKRTGLVALKVQLEADSKAAGPKGKMEVILRDAQDKQLAKIEVGEFGMGGSHKSHAGRKNFTGQVGVSSDIAERTARVSVTVEHTGSANQLLGVDAGDTIDPTIVVVETL